VLPVVVFEMASFELSSGMSLFDLEEEFLKLSLNDGRNRFSVEKATVRFR